MSPFPSESAPPATDRASSRVGACARYGLILGEGLVLGVSFDGEALGSLPEGWWTGPLSQAGRLMPLGAAILTSLLLIRWAQRRNASGPWQDVPFRFEGRTARAVGYQLAAFAALFLASRLLFRTTAASGPLRTGLVVASWLTTAVVTLALWINTFVPLRRVPGWLRRHAILIGGTCLVGIVAYLTGRLAQELWIPLRQLTFAATGTWLRLLLPDPIVDGGSFSVGTERFLVEIAPACSGYEGIGLTAVFVGVALWLFRDRLRFPRAFLLLAAGPLLAWCGNVARLVALVMIGVRLSPTVALGGFHSYAGALLFCGIALGVVAAALRSRWFSAREESPGVGNPAAPYLIPFLALIVASLVCRTFSDDAGQLLWPVRPAAGVLAILVFLPTYRRWAIHSSGMPPAVPASSAPELPPRVKIPWLAMTVGGAVAGFWIVAEALRRGGLSPTSNPSSMVAFAVNGAAAILVVPVAEELAFRGFLARRISARAFDELAATSISAVGIAGSSLAFALLHRHPLEGAIAGVCYGWLYRHRGRLSDSIIAHAVSNATLVVAALVTGSPDLWL